MGYSITVSEPNIGRTITLTAPTADEALYMARSWVSRPVFPVGPPAGHDHLIAARQPTVGELIKAGKPPTQGVVAQGFEAFGPMGERR